MNRRQFLTALTTLAVATSAGCVSLSAARRSSRRPLASISGHVFGRGLRFGALTTKNRSGIYPNLFVVPGEPVFLDRQTSAGGYTIAKVFTDEHGYFSFKDVPGGHYAVRTITGDTKLVHVTQAQSYGVSMFRKFYYGRSEK